MRFLSTSRNTRLTDEYIKI